MPNTYDLYDIQKHQEMQVCKQTFKLIFSFSLPSHLEPLVEPFLRKTTIVWINLPHPSVYVSSVLLTATKINLS